jgi:ketosteroid isomerase-like protein
MHTEHRDVTIRLACLFALLAGTALLAIRLRAGPLAPSAPDATAEIRSLLETQTADWNRGDVEKFLAGYWNSDQTAFAGSQGILHGWQALLERYRKSYPDRKAMGTLAFSGLEITLLCPDAALVLGKWHLEREAGPIGGVFSLVLRRFPGGWRIIADHTSVVAASAP